MEKKALCRTSVWQKPVAFRFTNQKDVKPSQAERRRPRLAPLHGPALGHRHGQSRSQPTAALLLPDPRGRGEPARRWAEEPRRQADFAPPVPPAEPSRAGPPVPPAAALPWEPPAARLHLDRTDWLAAAAAALLLAAARRARRLGHSASPERCPAPVAVCGGDGTGTGGPRSRPAGHPRPPTPPSQPSEAARLLLWHSRRCTWPPRSGTAGCLPPHPPPATSLPRPQRSARPGSARRAGRTL